MPNIDELTPLQDFPGYYIDTANGNVYSYFERRNSNGVPVLKQIKGRLLGKAKQLCFQLCIDESRKQFKAMHGRLMFSALHGISYFDIPKNAYVTYRQNDSGVSVRDRSEAASEAWAKKLEQQNKNRVTAIEQRISELSLIRQAYMGNKKPLFDYVFEQRKRIANIIVIKTGWSFQNASESFNAAVEVLYDVVAGKKLDNIYMLDRWIIGTAIGVTRRSLSKEAKQSDVCKAII